MKELKKKLNEGEKRMLQLKDKIGKDREEMKKPLEETFLSIERKVDLVEIKIQNEVINVKKKNRKESKGSR